MKVIRIGVGENINYAKFDRRISIIALQEKKSRHQMGARNDAG